MKRSVSLFCTMCALLLLAAGCGSDETDAETAEARAPSAAGKAVSGLKGMKGLGEAMSKMQEQAEKQKNFKVEPVDFRKLRALLPEVLPEAAGGLERTEMEGQKGGAMGMAVSSAEATYAGEAGRQLTIKLTDMGSVSGFAMMGFGWAMIEVDKETSSGYERTTEYEGHKAHEKYDGDRQRGEMQALVADRFVVEVEGWDVEMETVKAAMGALDLGALEGMKDEGVTRRTSS